MWGHGKQTAAGEVEEVCAGGQAQVISRARAAVPLLAEKNWRKVSAVKLAMH